MKWLRLAWFALAAAAVGLGADVAAWPMYQITSCEIGVPVERISTAADCWEQSLWEHFGWPLVVVLAAPVALCLVPAFVPRPRIWWTVVTLLFVATGVGLMSAVSSSAPNVFSALGGFLPMLVLALLLAIASQVVQNSWVGRSRVRSGHA